MPSRDRADLVPRRRALTARAVGVALALALAAGCSDDRARPAAATVTLPGRGLATSTPSSSTTTTTVPVDTGDGTGMVLTTGPVPSAAEPAGAAAGPTATPSPVPAPAPGPAADPGTPAETPPVEPSAAVGAATAAVPATTEAADDLGAAADVVRHRFIAAGVQPMVAVAGERLMVHYAGGLEPDDALDLARSRGELVARPVLAVDPACELTATVPAAPALDDDGVVWFRDLAQGCLQVGPGLVVPTVEADAVVADGRWSVPVTVPPGAVEPLSELASRCVRADPSCPGGRIAFMVDALVEAAPVARPRSVERPELSLVGPFAESEAKRLAGLLSQPPLARPLRVLVPPVGVRRVTIGAAALVGPATAVLVRFGPDDPEPSDAVYRLAQALAARLGLLGASAGYLVGDDQAGLLTVLVAGAESTDDLQEAIAAAGGVDDRSRMLVTSALVL
ncbi:MAG: hypothetical protein ACT4PW_02920 [Acidimicrobiia bacterium]